MPTVKFPKRDEVSYTVTWPDGHKTTLHITKGIAGKVTYSSLNDLQHLVGMDSWLALDEVLRNRCMYQGPDGIHVQLL